MGHFVLEFVCGSSNHTVSNFPAMKETIGGKKRKNPTKGKSKAVRRRLNTASDDDDEYQVEAVLGERDDGKLLVSWVGYDSSGNTWEPESELPTALVRRFRKQQAAQTKATPAAGNRSKTNAKSRKKNEDADTDYEVEALLEEGEHGFLVRWVGYPDPTWEPEQNLPKSLVRRFRQQVKAKAAASVTSCVSSTTSDLASEEKDADTNEYEVEAILEKRDDDTFLVRWVGFPEPTWEPEGNLPTSLLQQFRAKKEEKVPTQIKTVTASSVLGGVTTSADEESKDSDNVDAIAPRTSPRTLTEEKCATCGGVGGVGRKCECCTKPMHHYCSNEVAVSLGIVKDGAPLTEFGDICYCSKACYLKNTGSKKRSVTEAKKVDDDDEYQAIDSMDSDSSDYSVRPPQPLTKVKPTRAKASGRSITKKTKPSTTKTEVSTARKQTKRAASKLCGVCGDGGDADQTCSFCKKPLHSLCSKNVAQSLLILKEGVTLTEFDNGHFCSKECYQSCVANETAVGRDVAFSPSLESWMPQKLYKDVGSLYLVGKVTRKKKNQIGRHIDGQFELRWTTTQFQSANHVHYISLSKAQEGFANFDKLNGTEMVHENWDALCRPREEATEVPELWDDFVEVDSRYVRYDHGQNIPTDQVEVEKLASMQFHSNATLSAPSDLYTHPDGSTSTRLKPELKHIFLHSASSSFFAFLPISFWRKVVETTNAYAEGDKQPLVTLEELMKFLGILFYMTLVDKGEYANYWGDQVENMLFGETSTGLDCIMTLRRFRHIRKNLCFRDSVRVEHLKTDPVARIRPLISMLKVRCMKYVDVGRNVAVDETSIACRSKYARHLIVYNATKPTGKYHFKIYMCCCSTSWLTIGFRLHCESGIGERLSGVVSDDTITSLTEATKHSAEVRKHVIEATLPLHHTRRIVNTDNFYTSVQLLEAMKVQGLYCRGTIREASKHAPKCFMLSKKDKLERGTMRQGVNIQNNIVAASWVDGSVVNIISNADDSSHAPVSRLIGQRKTLFDAPKCVSEYNAAMQGVDRLDQIRSRFSLADGHSFVKFHKKLAMAFIDIAKCNAHICRSLAGIGVRGRDGHRTFVSELTKELFDGSWKNAIGDTGLLYSDPVNVIPLGVSTPTKPRVLTPSKLVPTCVGTSSKQLFPNQIAKRKCVVCRHENRWPTATTLFCATHNVSLCNNVYAGTRGDHICPDVDQTCWNKFHNFYFPRGLFNIDGRVRRSSSFHKARKKIEQESIARNQQSVVSRSFDIGNMLSTDSDGVSTDYCGSHSGTPDSRVSDYGEGHVGTPNSRVSTDFDGSPAGSFTRNNNSASFIV